MAYPTMEPPAPRQVTVSLDRVEEDVSKTAALLRWLHGKCLEHAPALRVSCGAVLLLYGRDFPNTVRCAQSFRLSHWEQVSERWGPAVQTYREARARLKQAGVDEVTVSLDIGNPGVAGWQGFRLLASIDPGPVMELGRALYSCGTLWIICALSGQAERVARGAHLGDLVADQCEGAVAQPLREWRARSAAQDAHLDEWLLTAVRMLFRSAGVWLAFRMDRVATTASNCLLGAELLTSGTAALAASYGAKAQTEQFRPLATNALAAYGFAKQAGGLGSSGMPAVLRFVLLPPLCVEGLLDVLLKCGAVKGVQA